MRICKKKRTRDKSPTKKGFCLRSKNSFQIYNIETQRKRQGINENDRALNLSFTSKIDIEKQLSLCGIILKRPLKLLLMLVCDCFATIFCAFISISITFALDIDKINRRMYNVIVTRAKSVMQLPDKKLITRREKPSEKKQTALVARLKPVRYYKL